MKDDTTEYQFSKAGLTLGIILYTIFISIMLYLSYTTYLDPSPYNDKKILGAIFLLVPILLLAVSVRRFFTITYSIIKNRPALILTKESFTDILNRKIIKWSDITEIADNSHFSGKYARNYITIHLKDPDKKFRIQDGGIKCKKQDLLQTLLKYHKKYK